MNNIRNILPEISKLKNICQSIAMLDAILMPDWEFRYYSFNSKWDKNEMMASMRNGSGDSYFILLKEEGVIIKGFYHESPIVKITNKDKNILKDIFDKIPKEFERFLNEPAFSINDCTFIFWRKNNDLFWNKSEFQIPCNENNDGSIKLLSILDGNPLTYKKWADEYYEKNIPFESINAIYEHNSITKDIIHSLNNELTLDDIQADIKEIGY
ncbi:MAG: hypothetical protein ACD_9C00006G0001 [uncultured bacterium]|nr:MAG: hypothetical protein ACD_9C00006G0001 [uncultured bacterium]